MVSQKYFMKSRSYNLVVYLTNSTKLLIIVNNITRFLKRVFINIYKKRKLYA
jgi:hypothetical protein